MADSLPTRKAIVQLLKQLMVTLRVGLRAETGPPGQPLTTPASRTFCFDENTPCLL